MTSIRYRWWALGALTAAVVAVSLPATVLTVLTVLNVAVPTLAGALGATAAQLQWFVAASLLALAAALLPAGLAPGGGAALDRVRGAFADAVGDMLGLCGVVAALGAVVAPAGLPRHPVTGQDSEDADEIGEPQP